MKRTVKRFLPILLGLVVILSIFWYMFSYDRSFTQDLLVRSAHFFEKHNNHAIANWFYNQAYIHSGNDDKIVIELANRFKENGNYTQAEVTLSNAISHGGSVDLYVALCKTYVEQDKLLDAVNMLESVPASAVKDSLEAMRPAVPVANPAPGFYNQYISVKIESNIPGSLYVATDGDYPSIKDVYTGEITLDGGENSIYAIAVGENGLVSQPLYLGYTIGGVIEEVTISDPVLDTLYRDMLGIGADAPLLSSDLWKITSLTISDDVADFSSLSRLSYLETLVIQDAKFDNLQMLAPLTQLKKVVIRGCSLSANDVSIIGSLPNLEDLTLSDCSLSSIAGLANAPRITTLDLSSNAIRDLSPLSFMDTLTSLDISRNAVTNLSALSALQKLSALDVSYNSLTSIAPLATCSSLSILVANNNQISEIPLFNNPAVLTVLTISNNNLTNVDILTKYTSLLGLSISYNQLTDISALGAMNHLTTIDFSHNNVSVIPTWGKDSVMVVVDGAYNRITSVAPLKGLPYLNQVIMDYNDISNINSLADCSMLVQVDVYGNPVKNVSKLTDRSIIVNYDPT